MTGNSESYTSYAEDKSHISVAFKKAAHNFELVGFSSDVLGGRGANAFLIRAQAGVLQKHFILACANTLISYTCLYIFVYTFDTFYAVRYLNGPNTITPNGRKIEIVPLAGCRGPIFLLNTRARVGRGEKIRDASSSPS